MVESIYSAAEAAYLASACLVGVARADGAASAPVDSTSITERTVHKAIEERIVRSLDPDRVLVDSATVLYLVATRTIEVRLPAEHKRRLYAALRKLGAPAEGWRVELTPTLYFSIPSAQLREWTARLEWYSSARERYIVSSPEIMGGAPVIKGTRIPVYSVLGRIEGGDTLDDLVEDYPHVDRDAFETAVIYARTHPRLGRPKRFRT